MDFRPLPSEDEPRIDLTSLIDVVFILLIFFMVTTTFNRQSELKVDLPQASSEVEKLPEEPIRLVIDRDGRYFINGNEVVNTSEDTLMKALDKALAANRERPVILQADARTEHQAVVTAMDAAAKLGVSQLSIATTQATGKQ
jgi:biopolymer transport protein ExbD